MIRLVAVMGIIVNLLCPTVGDKRMIGCTSFDQYPIHQINKINSLNAEPC